VVLKNLFSWFKRNEAPRTSGEVTMTASMDMDLKGNVLTLNVNGQKQVFDITAGIPTECVQHLAALGISAADVERMRHLHIPDEPASVTMRTTQVVSSSSTATHLTTKPLDSKLIQADIQGLLASGLNSSRSQLTVTINGRQETFDISSGVPAELADHLAKEMGLSPEQFAEFLKVLDRKL
jgi:hypothetical protein